MKNTVWQADGLRFDVEVEMQDPALLTLTGAALMVIAAVRGQEVVGTATLVEPTRVRCEWPAWALEPASHRIQLRATINGRTQTLIEFSQTITESLGEV